ncbi:hypothetical protein SAMN05192529_10297 [Arachidicoccus rhizosphaerae]|uniref:Uncharacterized protein n=1 Tax=Arachidicoccus rhizosphaerae TaxID=551991 RepID=A0A1H3W5K4_9BACT|nr:hypothetical protein [Arachidicoccus rhizosphaerae]SDZ81558.1 hypothetical protein SAMN05192529_10297 [Arachidicoccus rhizosphaerae]
METKIAKKREIVINDRVITWQSGKWTIGTDYFTIGDESVKVGISGQGNCILRQGLENEAEYEEFDKEIEYSFEDLGVYSEIFEEMSREDAISEIISLTVETLKNAY